MNQLLHIKADSFESDGLSKFLCPYSALEKSYFYDEKYHYTLYTHTYCSSSESCSSVKEGKERNPNTLR